MEFFGRRKCWVPEREVENFISMNLSEVVSLFKEVTDERWLGCSIEIFLSQDFSSCKQDE